MGTFWLEGSAEDKQSVMIATGIGLGPTECSGGYMGWLRTRTATFYDY